MNFKNIIPKVLLVVILISICCIGIFKYTTNIKSNNSENITICSDCEEWEKVHNTENTVHLSVITECPSCGKERPHC